MNPMKFLPMLTRVLEEVNRFSLPGPGFTRPSYSDEESRAHECVAGICEALGLKVRTLHRVGFAGVSLEGCRRPGDWAFLTEEELALLRRSADEAAAGMRKP